MHQRNQYYYMLITLLFFSSFLCVQNLLAVHTPTAESNIINVYSDSPEFELTLKSNPTTGYQWYLVEINDDLILSVSKSYDQNKAKQTRIGASGTETWRFKVKESAFIVPRITTLTFNYLRPWQATDTKNADVLAPTYKIIINPFKKPTNAL